MASSKKKRSLTLAADRWRAWFYKQLEWGIDEKTSRLVYTTPTAPDKQLYTPDWNFLDNVLPYALAEQESKARRIEHRATKESMQQRITALETALRNVKHLATTADDPEERISNLVERTLAPPSSIKKVRGGRSHER